MPGGSQLQSAEGHARVDTARGNLQYTSLYSFGAGGGSDGLTPESGLTRFNGALYGTTTAGGAYGQGTVFKISTAGVESVVHSFGVTREATGLTSAGANGPLLLPVGGSSPVPYRHRI